MNTYQVAAAARRMLLVLAMLGTAQYVVAQGESPEPIGPEEDTFTFKAGRSHAGGFRYIAVALTLAESGMSWRFEDEFETHVDIQWSALKTWSCWGESHGYKLELVVPEPEDGGGTFKLRKGELKQAEAFLLETVPEKAEQRCAW